MPARTDCCNKKAKYCGWNPRLNPYALKQLEGDLNIVPVGSQFASTGSGVSVLRGILGTQILGKPGAPTNLYGRIQYSGQSCNNIGASFPLVLDDDLTILYAPGCTLRIPAATYNLNLGSDIGDCCIYFAGEYSPSIGGIRHMFTMLVSKTIGQVVLRIELPYDASHSIGARCGEYFPVIYVGSIDGDAINLNLTDYGAGIDTGDTPPCYGDLDHSVADVPENSNFPEHLSISVPPGDVTLWVGIKNSIGIAVTPSSRKFSAVMLDGEGQIASTIAELALTEPTLALPFGAFWWNETGKAQFAIFDQKPSPAPLGYFDVLDYIAIDVDVDQPDNDTHAYLGASGAYSTFVGFVQCVAFPSCWPQYGINQTTNAYPFSWRIDGFDDRSPCILWNGHGSLRPGEVLQGSLGCEWINSWGTRTEGSTPGSGNVTFWWDIGLTDPDTANLRMHFVFTTTPDPLSGEQETYTVDAQWSAPLSGFDGYIPNTLSIYESSSSEPEGTSICLPPLMVTMVPLP